MIGSFGGAKVITSTVYWKENLNENLKSTEQEDLPQQIQPNFRPLPKRTASNRLHHGQAERPYQYRLLDQS
jgi:hypothetical protein